jgi:uncharacterized coiled-coil protein SlyX
MGLVSPFAIGVAVYAQQPQTSAETRQLVQRINELNETLSAQATALVDKSAQIRALQSRAEQVQREAVPACIAAFERANPGKTLDPETLAVKDAPAKDGDR